MNAMKIMKRVGKLCFVCLLFLMLGVIAGRSESKAVSTYKVRVNKQCCVVTVYKYDTTKSKYKPVKAFVCSPGYATPVGTYPLGEKMRWHVLDGPCYGQYCSRITGGFLFHSVWYYSMEKNTQSYVQYNRLGTLASHGCVRLTVADAKWIFDNVPSGSPVQIYNSSKPGPLGKPTAIKVTGSQGWDPTDPDPANPYAKKKPVIYGVKNRTIKAGESFNVKAGITAKNTTGFSATNRIKTKIYYRATEQDEYVLVKKLNTKKGGFYKVVYSVTDEINHKASKTAIITVKSDSRIKSITLSDMEKTIYVGGLESQGQFVLSAKKITPADAPNQTLEFSSASTKVVTVDEDGTVKAVAPGKAYVTAKTTDGSGVTAKCLVTVEQLVTEVRLTVPGKKLEIGRSMQAKVTVLPEDAADKTVTYTSSKPEVATVSETGSITAVAVGKTTIKVTANDPGKKMVKVTITVYDPQDPGAVSGSAAKLAIAEDAAAETPAEEPVTFVTKKNTVRRVSQDISDRKYDDWWKQR